MNILFLIGGEWITVLLNLPLVLYHLNKYRTRPVMSGFGVYDPTTVIRSDSLTVATREGWIKLGFYMITFFYYLYCMIAELIRD